MEISEFVYRRFFRTYVRDKEDLLQEGEIALLKAYKGYDSSKGKFETYAVRVVKNAMLDYVRSRGMRNQQKTFGLEEDTTLDYLEQKSEQEGSEYTEKLGRDVKIICFMAEKEFTVKQQTAIRLWTGGINCKQVSKLTGYSVQGVCDIVNKFKERFKELWNNRRVICI